MSLGSFYRGNVDNVDDPDFSDGDISYLAFFIS